MARRYPQRSSIEKLAGDVFGRPVVPKRRPVAILREIKWLLRISRHRPQRIEQVDNAGAGPGGKRSDRRRLTVHVADKLQGRNPDHNQPNAALIAQLRSLSYLVSANLPADILAVRINTSTGGQRQVLGGIVRRGGGAQLGDDGRLDEGVQRRDAPERSPDLAKRAVSRSVCLALASLDGLDPIEVLAGIVTDIEHQHHHIW